MNRRRFMKGLASLPIIGGLFAVKPEPPKLPDYVEWNPPPIRKSQTIGRSTDVMLDLIERPDYGAENINWGPKKSKRQQDLWAEVAEMFVRGNEAARS